MLNRCQEGIEEARALLGLVLCHVASHDPSWQEERVVKGRKNREDVEVRIRGALWLADLKFRAWVPVPGEDDKLSKVRADAATLKHLLEPSWLENNPAAIRLLADWFGFDELELRLGLAPDPDKRRELRSGVAKLLETGGGDPAFYTSLAEEQRRKKRDIGRFQRIGFAVQEAVKQALEDYGLHLTLIDRGFDYEVTMGDLEDAAASFEVGPYFLEIKATTTGQARLTPTKAETASAEASRYVLCVVNLQDLSNEELDGEWAAENSAASEARYGHRAGRPGDMRTGRNGTDEFRRHPQRFRLAIRSPEVDLGKRHFDQGSGGTVTGSLRSSRELFLTND